MTAEKLKLPTREEISKLPQEAQVALAARSATRVYPLIMSQGYFDFWKDEAGKNMQLIWAAVSIATFGDVISSVAYDVARLEGVEAIGYASDSAAYAVYAASYAANSDYRVTARAYAAIDAANIAVQFAYVGELKGRFVEAIRNDFIWLKEVSGNLESLWRFFQRPLFDGQSVLLEEILQPNISDAFNETQSGKDVLILWQQFFAGNLSKAAMQAWLDGWKERNGVDVGKSEPNVKQEKWKDPEIEAAHLKGRESFRSTEVEGKATDTNAIESEQEASSAPKFMGSVAPGAAASAADRPATEDALDRAGLVKNLANMLSMPQQGTPITIGLFGDWGSGKSTVMQLLQKELSSDETRGQYPDFEFLFGWFNVWEYEHTKDIRAGLAQEVVNGLLSDGVYNENEPRLSGSLGTWERWRLRWCFLRESQSREMLMLLLKVLAAVIALMWGLLGFGADSLVPQLGVLGVSGYFLYSFLREGKVLLEHPLATELATFFKLPSYREELGQIPVMRQQLEDLCKVRLFQREDRREPRLLALLKCIFSLDCDSAVRVRRRGVEKREQAPLYEAKRRLVLFVDDLDRCHTENIAKAFDAIRLITDIEGVVVIVGVDERIAFKAMAQTYKDYAGGDSSEQEREAVARDYLGKIIQIPIRLGVPAAAVMGGFIDSKLFPQKDRRQRVVEFSGAGGRDLLKERAQVANEPVRDMRGAQDGEEAVKPKLGADDQIDSVTERSKLAEVVQQQKAAVSTQLERAEAMKLWSQQQRALMQETDAEVRAFKQLAKWFEIGNPRQLIRLRNTYRLLKAMDPKRMNPDEVALNERATVEFPKVPHAILLMLFWLEFELPTNDADRARCLEALRKLPPRVAGFELESFLQQVDAGFETVEWAALKRFAKTCLLPYPAKELG